MTLIILMIVFTSINVFVLIQIKEQAEGLRDFYRTRKEVVSVDIGGLEYQSFVTNLTIENFDNHNEPKPDPLVIVTSNILN